MMQDSNGKYYEFGSFRVDPVKRLLLRDGSPVALPPKAFDALMILLDNSGRVVERNDLMAKLWPDTFVEDINLNVQISSLRKALGENPFDHHYIVTVPRRGYSFVATVSRIEIGNVDRLIAPDPSSPRIESSASHTPLQKDKGGLSSVTRRFVSSRGQRIAVAASILLVALASVFFLWVSAARPQFHDASPGTTMAVLPFKHLSSEDEEYLGLGMADALITKLSNIKSMTVRPTSAVIRYDNPEADSLAAGREMKVEMVLEGKIQRTGERLRVTVQMLRVSDGAPLWAESFDESFSNIFAVQDSISRRVAEAVRVKLNAEEKQMLARKHTGNLEAYQAYVRGRYFWNKRSVKDLEKAIEYFKEAIEIEPSYALAYSGLADALNLLIIFGEGNPEDLLPKAKAAALKAVESDDSLAEAHASLAFAMMRSDWNWNKAESEFRRALALNPNYPAARYWYADLLLTIGKTDEAIAQMRLARDVDPLSPATIAKLGWASYWGRRYDEAIARFRESLDLNPDYSPALLGLSRSFEQKGMHREALVEQAKIKAMTGPDGPLLAASGNKREAVKAIETYRRFLQEKEDSSYALAETYAALGHKDDAFNWLEKAFQNRNSNLLYIKVNPRLDNLRSDPRFAELLRRMMLEA